MRWEKGRRGGEGGERNEGVCIEGGYEREW